MVFWLYCLSADNHPPFYLVHLFSLRQVSLCCPGWLKLVSSSDPPASASLIAGTTAVHHRSLLQLPFSIRMRHFLHNTQGSHKITEKIHFGFGLIVERCVLDASVYFHRAKFHLRQQRELESMLLIWKVCKSLTTFYFSKYFRKLQSSML